MSSRPSEVEYLLDVARVVATRSTCSRLSVGAVIARDGHILSTGRNGAPAGLAHCPDPHPDGACQQSVHAEVNALALAARHGNAVAGATLYCTHAPCLACAGPLINAGLAAVRYGRAYRDDRGPLRLAAAGLHVARHPVLTY